MTYNWNDEKNEELKQKRNISFEEIVICLNEKRIRAVLEHPNKKKYSNQYLYLIEYNKYIYVVPFIENKDENEIFLKTIYHNREYTRKYLKRRE